MNYTTYPLSNRVHTDTAGLPTYGVRPEGSRAARVSRNLRFALFTALRVFPQADKFIVLEDDLVLSPDFYSYMQQTGWVLDHDPSVYCVSAYNHLSYAHTAHDLGRLYRVHGFPAYGWMMKRDTLAYILPKWLPSNVTHDWDYFMDTSAIRGRRECVVPEVNRSYHGGGSGLHLRLSWSTEHHYLARPYNHHASITFINLTRLVEASPPSFGQTKVYVEHGDIPYYTSMMLERLLQEEYEREMVSLLRAAVPLHVDDLADNKIQFSPGGVYVISADMKSDKDTLAFRDIGDKLGVWSGDARDSHHYSWRLHYQNATLLVVGTPISRYTHFLKRGTPVVGASPSTERDLEVQDLWKRFTAPLLTHYLSPFMPVGAQMVNLVPLTLPSSPSAASNSSSSTGGKSYY
ncbi:protein O-linked-mannose beta-1,2-N-acetylglucosaminyltransferase 1-like [Homarus americanus]|uniref:protein O-linked-mannose beta-1,2-N-acetylglucosaminyltransferase 1-like n=1 Tax=Homarus americanus TaxID=6706 RepID=UPI001C43F061|nr:protein O-linked-mannose beta-1,2-N-acetylglucosaminyltransferase 1-like [Homarus americanus]